MEKEINGFDGYSVDEFGNVFSSERKIVKIYKKAGKIVVASKKRKKLAPVDNGLGYKMVTLTKNGRHLQKYIHRLVAEAFIENPLGLREVNHIDGDKSNNSVSNLEWITHRDNIMHCLKTIGRKTRKGKKVICIETGKIYDSMKDAAKANNIKAVGISHCVCGHAKTTGGLHWKLV